MSKFNYDFNKPRTIDEMWRAREIELLEEILAELKKITNKEEIVIIPLEQKELVNGMFVNKKPGEVTTVEKPKPQRKPRAKKV